MITFVNKKTVSGSKRPVAVTALAVLALLLVVFLLAALLPAWLSSPVGTRWLLGRVNQRVEGEIALDGLELSWLGSNRVAGLAFKEPERIEKLHVDLIMLDRGLFHVLMKPRQPGRVIIKSPSVTIREPEPEAPAAEAASASPMSPSTTPVALQPTPAGERASLPAPPLFALQAEVQQASVSFRTLSGELLPVVRQADLQISRSGFDEPLTWQLNIQLPGQLGSLDSSGSVRLPVDGLLLSEALQVEADLNARDLKLDELTRMLSAVTEVPPVIGALNAKISMDGNGADGLTFNADVGIDELAFPEANISLGPVAVQLDGRLSAQDLQINHFAVQTEPAAIRLNEVAAEWQPALRLSATGNLDGDLAKVAVILRAANQLPEDIDALSGRLSAAWQIELTAAEELVVRLNADVANLLLQHADGWKFEESEISHRLSGRFKLDGSEAVLDELTVKLSALSINATGRYSHRDQKRTIRLNGRATADLPQVAAFVRDVADMPLEMEGRSDTPFYLQSDWTGADWDGLLARADGEWPLRADRIKAFGLEVAELDIPLQLQAGRLVCPLRAGVNGGQLALTAGLDFNESPRAIRLNEVTNILTDVKLTDELANELFALIHPLLEGASGASGRTDFVMSELYWPLDKQYLDRAAFKGKIEFRDVTMRAAGLSDVLLKQFNISERVVDIGDKTIRFEAADRRIHSTPLRTDLGDTELHVDGTMGFDQTLDYMAEVPVSEDMVGREVYPYVKGTVIRIPIRGSASRPRPDFSALDDVLSDAAGRAINKVIEDKATEWLQDIFKQ